MFDYCMWPTNMDSCGNWEASHMRTHPSHMRTHQDSVPALFALFLERFEPPLREGEGLGPSIVWIGAGLLRDPGSGEEPEPRGRGGPLSGPARMVRAAALSRYERARAGASVSECPRVQCTVAECHRVHCHRYSTSGYEAFEPAVLVPYPYPYSQ